MAKRGAMEGGCNGPDYTNRLLELYEEAREINDVAARVEVRVPLRRAKHVLLSFPFDLFRQTALLFPRRLWW